MCTYKCITTSICNFILSHFFCFASLTIKENTWAQRWRSCWLPDWSMWTFDWQACTDLSSTCIVSWTSHSIFLTIAIDLCDNGDLLSASLCQATFRMRQILLLSPNRTTSLWLPRGAEQDAFIFRPLHVLLSSYFAGVTLNLANFLYEVECVRSICIAAHHRPPVFCEQCDSLVDL